MNKFSRTARSVTFAAIVGLSLGVSAPGAFAQTDGVQVADVAKANIDFKKTGSITIHKRDLNGDKPGENATGDVIAEKVPGKPLGGVTFQIQKVNLDLKKNADWARIPKDVAGAEGIGFDQSFGTGGFLTQETDTVNGEAKFTQLPLGIYVVRETKAPDGVVKGAPFLASVPMTDSAGKAWDYEVDVYPKNTKVKAEKEVSDADKNHGDQITYTLKTPIPALLTDTATVKRYKVSDDYDETKVKPNTDSMALYIGDPNGKAEEGEKIDPSAYEITDNAGKVEVVFKNFDKLNKAAKAGGKVVFTVIPATVNKIDASDAEIINKAQVTFNNPSNDSETEDINIPTNEVRTYLGSVEVTKKDAGEKDKVLKGAKFELYKSSDQKCDGVGETRILEDQNLVTGEDGKLTIKGLHVTNLEDAVKVINNQYCLKEVEAPAGYAVPTGGAEWTSFKITVDEQKGDGDKITSAKIKNAAVQVNNKKTPTPELPMTGGAGVGILAAIGAAIIGAGAWFARRNSAES
ncbi:fimbrial assembly protein [Corynebacterium diphtheriae]|uniref:SpaH/EbpB family LPXTG-anchored major pilin n=1 Tax=Corynebacterium diphtheriae TaxID=1717 RepID=UPI00092B5B49|nr:SpaH/EbpB family LPXTG-anchored major pilin [Corynebacterium diphtheriae]MBG9345391.1 SpaH/EbpB family LPXTG-anchored major pilin [Corynebacterium diphtheriae bv. gravis]MBG9352355.1 SpaH/EbpB family LPXTG-anchored major pilin [Corynebacterium diphtheriae bv. gravis]OJH92916.1 fimbrial assembly protein [Corynebacterium diphtheriae]